MNQEQPRFLPPENHPLPEDGDPFAPTIGEGVEVAGAGIGFKAFWNAIGESQSTRAGLMAQQANRRKGQIPGVQRAEAPPSPASPPPPGQPTGKGLPDDLPPSPFADERDPEAELIRKQVRDLQDRRAVFDKAEELQDVDTPGQPRIGGEPLGEARAFHEQDFDELDLDQSWQTNFDVIDEPDEVKNVIGQVAEWQKGKIDEARRGVITDKQLYKLAHELDVDRDVVRQVMLRETGDVINAETILAARMVLHRSAERLKTLADKIVLDRANVKPVERVQFMRQMYFHRAYQTQFMGARAETGRALRAS